MRHPHMKEEGEEHENLKESSYGTRMAQEEDLKVGKMSTADV